MGCDREKSVFSLFCSKRKEGFRRLRGHIKYDCHVQSNLVGLKFTIYSSYIDHRWCNRSSRDSFENERTPVSHLLLTDTSFRFRSL